MTTTYEPTSTIIENWGRLQIVIGNKDRTFYRGVPTLVQNWSSAEPFDDKSLTLLFPGITSFEALDVFPFVDFDSVDIWLVDENNNQVKRLWEGFMASSTDDLSVNENGLTVECLGALYQIDFFLKVPSFSLGNKDAAFAISEEVNLRARYYGLRLKQMSWLSLSSTPTRSLGSWNPLLTGWIQELLGASYSPAYMQDGERAIALQVDQQYGGYEMIGDYSTILTFGPRMPNYGSSTWWNATFIHLFNDDGFYISDIYMNPITRVQFTLSRGGSIDIRDDGILTIGQWEYYKGDATAGMGKSTSVTIERYHMAIHSTDDDRGYRVVNASGVVKCFGNAAHHGDRPPLTPLTFANGSPLTVDFIIDMVRTKSGNGYWLLSWGGKVFNFGDAAPFAHFPLNDCLYSAIEVTEDGNGIWALDIFGRVQTRGTAINYGSVGPNNGNMDPKEFAMDISRSKDGNGYVVLGHWGGIFTKGDAQFYRSGVYMESENSGGNVTQWTMMKYDGRMPVIRTKNTWTTNHTCTVGTPGITHSLTRDRTQLPNTFYGDGTDPTGCKWRNSKYPNFSLDTNPPLWPGYYMSEKLNSRSEGVLTWQRRMQQSGWPITVDGIFDSYDQDACRFLQNLAGIQIDGVIGPQTWAVTFQPGSNSGSLDSAYIAPLVLDNRVEPFLYSGNGATIGENPNFDKSLMRIESYSNYGDKASKREATISATNELIRNRDIGYYGNLTLAIDPEGSSRFEIKAGQNIEYKGYRGEDILLHITDASIDFAGQTVSLTVDTKARDNETVMAMIERDRIVGEPVGVPTRPSNSSSKQVEDKVVFDCESNAGWIPWFYLNARLWSVVRVPLGEVGSIAKTHFVAQQPEALFSMAVFDRIIHPYFLLEQGGGNPLDDDKYWQNFPDDRGLMQAWGNASEMCGFYPGRSGTSDSEDPDPWTGVMLDGSGWQFWSSSPPWVWVAFWSDTTTVVGGRFWPGGDSGFNFAGSDAIANPMEIHPQTRVTTADFNEY